MEKKLLSSIATLLLAFVLPLAATTTTVSAASASPTEISPRVTLVREIAGQSPFIGQSCNLSTVFDSSGGQEAEPYIAVNPTNPENLIGAWMDATRATIDTAYSTDGGSNWHVVVPQGIDNCTGNKTTQWEASDSPTISFGPDGVAYLSTLTWTHFVTPPSDQYISVVHIHTSSDGGRSWSNPTLVSGSESVADAPTVVANPHRPGVAYEIWRNQAYRLPVGARGATSLNFQMTRDHGSTWNAPSAIATANPDDLFGTPQLSVLDDGTLVATSSLGNTDGTSNEMAWRSIDGGHTWQGPSLIRVASAGSMPAICGQATSGGDGSAASGQQQVLDGRSVLLITNDGAAETSGAGKIILSRSDDGGLTWYSSTVFQSLQPKQPIVLASIAVNHQQVGLEFDQIDTGSIDCTKGTIPVRSQFAVASVRSNGEFAFSKPVTLGAASWNLESALRPVFGYYLGGYQSLAATPRGFAAVTVQGQPLAPGGPMLTGLNGVIVAKVSTTGDQ